MQCKRNRVVVGTARANFIVYDSGMQERLRESIIERIMRSIPKQKQESMLRQRVSCNMQERQNNKSDTLRSGARFPIGRFTALATSACEF
jgi:hypothetical protein